MALGRQVVHDPPADRDRPRRDFLQARDGPKRGGLAAARRPDKYYELSVGDVETQIIDALNAARVSFVHSVKNDLSHNMCPHFAEADAGSCAGCSERSAGLVTTRLPAISRLVGCYQIVTNMICPEWLEDDSAWRGSRQFVTTA